MPHGIRSRTMSTYVSILSPQSVPHLHTHLIADRDARGCVVWSSWNHSTDLAHSRKQCMSSMYLDALDYMVAGVEGPNFDDTSFRRHPLRNTGYVRLCLDQRMHEMASLPTYCRACGDDLALLECIRLFTNISPGSHLEKKKHMRRHTPYVWHIVATDTPNSYPLLVSQSTPERATGDVPSPSCILSPMRPKSTPTIKTATIMRRMSMADEEE